MLERRLREAMVAFQTPQLRSKPDVIGLYILLSLCQALMIHSMLAL